MKSFICDVMDGGRHTGIILYTAILSLIPITLPAATPKITTESLKQTEAKIRQLTNRNLPATVALIPTRTSGMMGTGSGVIVSEDGLILTAAHVTMTMSDNVTVIFPDGKRANGRVLGMDYSRDSGMVQITDPGKYPFVQLGDSDALIENEWCVALGHAGGYQHDRSPPVRLGRIIQNNPNKFIRTDSTLIAGDSGGPLFDVEGRLIGIHSNIGMSLLQNNHVPISTYISNWNRLKRGERFGGNDPNALLVNPDRPMIGALLMNAPNGGALVDSVKPGSPAEKAGLRKGDRIIEADNRSIKDSDGLIAAIRKHTAGATMKLVVESSGAVKTLSVKLSSARKVAPGSPGRGPLQKAPRRTPEEAKQLQADFDRIMRQSIEQRKLKLTETFYERFRSSAEFNQYMNRFKRTLSRDELKILARIAAPKPAVPVRPNTHDPDKPIEVAEDFFREVLDSFRPSVANASTATHHVFRGQEWKSLCTIVHRDGYAVTKASEIDTKNNQKLGVLIGKGNLVPARLVKTYPKYDLALIKLKDQSGLPAVRLTSSGELPTGSLISVPGTGPDPLAIGLISVPPRSLTGENKGFLGIRTAPHNQGVRVTGVVRDASAGKAGVKSGDIITKIDNAICDTPEKLIKQISGREPGTDVILQLLRNGRGTSIKVTLGDRKELDDSIPDPSGKMNRMGTEVSEKSSGFPRITQTDLPIQPRHCGGPVVDLKGNVVGINIARAGRIKTYMIPAGEVRRLIAADLPTLSGAY